MSPGAKIEQARKEAGLSQEAAARAIGVSLRTYQRHEHTRLVPREWKFLVGLADATGKPVEFFLEGLAA